ncbi:Bug family tripartite tricarboxylate transporter substrate binding protein [Oligella urethralis]|uniref:ABC transporter substrate-binding protein n=1 Tax=Oligella urethralis DNF00040 TaxID=1401065 RepID=A0A096AK90_9BURK|nr:tripartite tricarboxylate transporter substrate binding protein [Oligella urethralis]KGF31087.1 ABC transporter substrate-binding protein [Oligella urethralis DNF00040]
MNNHKRNFLKPLTLTALGVGLCLTNAPALADEASNYPNKVIHFVVPYAAGGPLDAAARQLGERVQETLGQNVIVENKAGAGGNVGLASVAQAKADGYTLGMGAVATMAINPWLYQKMPFDPSKDFAPVILLSNVPNVLILNKKFATENGINDVQTLVDYLKQHGDKVNYASGGNGSAGHLAGELFKQRAAVDMLHIPYQGANPAKMALLANQTQLMFDNLASSLPQIKADEVVALAVTTAERSSFLSEVPTLEESGIANFDISTWFGVVAPAGTPEAIIEKLNQAYAEGMKDERVQQQMRNMASDLEPGSAQDFTNYAKEELAKYQEMIKAAAIKLD